VLKQILAGATVALAAALAAAAVADAPASQARTDVALVAYSTPREAYAKLTSAFQNTAAGRDVAFVQSYGSSGEQARAVRSGLDADVVALSLEPDMTTLVRARLVPAGWNRDAFKGMVTRSVVVFVVRDGNPKKIRDWKDLIKPGVEVVTPNVQTSGGAKWNVMAAYGAQLEAGRSEAEAVEYLRRLFANVSVQDKSARESLQTFTGGKGDVLIAYENEAITAQQKGEELDYVIPDETILIENPIAVTTDAPPAAQAFVDFLRTPTAQRIFGEKGYRPVDEKVFAEFDYPQPASLFTIEEVGGWDEVMTKFFDRENGIVARIEEDLGVSTESG
jgi:sulfate/thiosulfate transport system substrate-binding protein